MANLTPYRMIAKDALMSWNGLSEADAEKTVISSSFDDLEGQVWATGSIAYAVDAIAKLFQLSDQEKQDFSDAILAKDHAEISKKDQKIFDRIAKKALGTEEKSVLYILSSIHDGWVKDNAKKFNQEGREARRYQHLPIELIGFKEAKADLLFVGPILEAVGVNVDQTALQTEYDESVVRFLDRNNITSKASLANKIMQGTKFYKPLTEKNTAQSEDVAKAMADKVVEVNKAANLAFKANTLG